MVVQQNTSHTQTQFEKRHREKDITYLRVKCFTIEEHIKIIKKTTKAKHEIQKYQNTKPTYIARISHTSTSIALRLTGAFQSNEFF